MKILNNLPIGGFKTYSDDLRFMTKINKDVFEMLVAPLTDLYDVIILQGCDISTSGGNTIVTPGVLVYRNELMRFNGLTFATPTSGKTAHWVYDDLILKSRVFQAGNTENVHLDRVATIGVSSNVPPGSQDINSTKRFWEVVNESIIHPPYKDSYFFEDVSEFNNLLTVIGQSGPYVSIDCNRDTIVELGSTGTIGHVIIAAIEGSARIGDILKFYFNDDSYLGSGSDFGILVNDNQHGTSSIINGTSSASFYPTLNKGEVYSIMKINTGWLWLGS